MKFKQFIRQQIYVIFMLLEKTMKRLGPMFFFLSVSFQAKIMAQLSEKGGGVGVGVVLR